MYTIFKESGDIDEVIISQEEINVENALVSQGSRKIHANLPRFNREFTIRETTGVRVQGKHMNRRDPGHEGDGVENMQNKKICVNGYNARWEQGRNNNKLEVENSGPTYNMQEYFNMEGYFGVKVTPLGSNLYLLEEREDGELKALIKEASDWINQWFVEIRPWSPKEVDNERLTWLRVFGLPCHAWHAKVFDFMSKSVGVFICVDEETTKHKTMDVARILIRTKYCMVLNETYNISINENIFRIKVVEDTHDPMCIPLNHLGNNHNNSNGSAESSDEDNGCWE
ncbi:unnamed protein product [Vicia faba]|uniref:DUF4283 domain-containing protein n=1 Tax=Vicia faba TaxID=3906 RepID=A0AAV1AM79_VICFA|nr:unnamed protein product [Vicia faba]